MPQAILCLKDMCEEEACRTGSKKLLNMHLIYKIGLPGLLLNYALPWWNINDLEQIKKDVHTIANEAEKHKASLMVRSSHYREISGKALPEVSMPFRVDRKTPEEIYEAIIDVLEESQEMVKKSSIDAYKPNIIISTFIRDCHRSGMIHVHKNIFEIHSMYGNVVAMLRYDYPYDTIIIDKSFNVLDKILRKKNQMMNAGRGEFIVEDVPLEEQNRLSVSEAEIPLFVDQIKIMVRSFPDKEIDAMWLQQRDSEICYSYLDVAEPQKEVKRVALDESPVIYSPKMNLSELKGRTVYVPAEILNDREEAENAITFIAFSGAKAVLLPKKLLECAHKLKNLRKEGVYYETAE